ncbi:hypothetical protein IFO69_20200 [Echinicola sp. CAU 1574]|uniref:DUF927 domain-containing protein n=1 Tax=Echinicola arenosa TaxID=2774144 RepID=A0ABR9ARV4_9BACT|nr:hypothetical protein [Echinicola arenosa]MBD8491087.1 hypothetical protein [Echinicola arenosa]
MNNNINKDKTVNSDLMDGIRTDIDNLNHEWSYSWPEEIEAANNFNEPHLKWEINKYKHLIFNNCIYHAVYDFKEKIISLKKISNFHINPLYLVPGTENGKRIVELQNENSYQKIISIPAKSLVYLNEFKTYCEPQGNFLFEGNASQYINTKKRIYDNTKNVREIEVLGWQKEGFYAFANGIIKNGIFHPTNEHGLCRDPDKVEETLYLIPALSPMYNNDSSYEVDRTIKYLKHEYITFKEWIIQFYKVFGDNGILSSCFYISCLFRDIIYKELKYFPHLFHFGESGTGKSTICWSIQYMFGERRNPYNLDSGTDVSFHRTFAQFRNGVVWFDEYSNSIDPKRGRGIKGAYDGSNHSKADTSIKDQSNNRTARTPVYSGCNISGQERPTMDIAIFNRCILLTYTKTIYSPEEQFQLSKLQKMEKEGLSHITAHITKYRNKINQEYFLTFESVRKDINGILKDDPHIKSRIINNMVTILTTWKILSKELKWPFDWEKVLSVAAKNVRDQNNFIAKSNETNAFWEEVEYLISENELTEKGDFKIEYHRKLKILENRRSVDKDFGGLKKILFIRLNNAYHKYLEGRRRKGERPGLDKGSLIHYLENTHAYIGQIKSTSFYKDNRRIVTSAFLFDCKILEESGLKLDMKEDYPEENNSTLNNIQSSEKLGSFHED